MGGEGNFTGRFVARWRATAAIFVSLLLLAPQLASAAATFTATLDRDTVAAGETATLTLTFEGGDPESIQSFDVPGIQIASGQMSRNVSIVNGQASSSVTQTLLLTPTQPGDYTIPALQARVSGQTLTSAPLKLKVVKPGSTAADAAGTESLAFVKLFVPRKEIFAGEVITVEVQVYLRNNVANAEQIMQSIDNFNGAAIKAEGFSVLKTGHAAHRSARVGNGIYNVATLVTAVSPIKTGPLTISSMDFPLPLRILAPNQPRNTDPFWDPFGTFQRYQQKQVNLVADPETVNALPLPRENVPPSFNGAVGTFTMAASAGPTNVAAGDPVTVKVQITGRGALDSLNLPDNPGWKEFKTYPPTTKIDTVDPLGLQGTKTFEQVVVPQSTTIQAIPELAFSFFDPEQKAYKTLKHAPIPLIVRPGGTTVAPSLAAGSARGQENAPAARDIVTIKDRLGALAQVGPPLVSRPWFLALQALPVVAFISALLWRKRANAFASNPRLRRQRMTAVIVRNGLMELRRLATENRSDEFFASLFRLLQEQLGERLDLPASAITEAVIDEHLHPRGVPQYTIAQIEELFQMCNLARYAPMKTSQELAAVIPKFESAVEALKGIER
jgi:GH25 family lysozyme M1 (1,4-beta-N-acetylmuramidase)